jgi:hypothetical protein
VSIELGFIFTMFTVAKSASGTLTSAADLPHTIHRFLGIIDSLDG